MLSVFKSGLKKTKKVLFDSIKDTSFLKTKPDEIILDALEESLIQTDMGFGTVDNIIDVVRNKKQAEWSLDSIKDSLKDKMVSLLEVNQTAFQLSDELNVILIVGVNGVGKTTTIAKLAKMFKKDGKEVLLAGCDTFRAGAIDQLKIWGERAEVPVISHQEGADPSAVAFDALDAALAKKVDVLMIDTAGRLHTKKNLMEELKKISKTLSKKFDGAPHHTLLVLDAATGQNALNQTTEFNTIVPLSGLVITKLDGTAKGGMLFQIKEHLNVPIYFVGLGEQMDDLQHFNHLEYVEALLETNEE